MRLLRDDRGSHYVCWDLSKDRHLVYALAELTRYHCKDSSASEAIKVMDDAKDLLRGMKEAGR